MSKYCTWIDGNPVDIIWRKYPHPDVNGYKVYVGDQYVNLVLGRPNNFSGWSAIVTPNAKARGKSTRGFKTRWHATMYLLWAQGVSDGDDQNW